MQLIFLLNMARIHAHTRGQSHSTRPTSKNAPSWVAESPAQLSALVLQLSKEGLTPNYIGINLRDEYGIALIKSTTGKTITKILLENNIKEEMPEDLDQLIRKAIGLQQHIKAHNSDRINVRSLELIEAKIHRLSKYYKRGGKLRKNWKYAAVIAQLE